jgi:hypothetical protein
MLGVYNYVRETNHTTRLFDVEDECSVVTIYGTYNCICHVECVVLLHYYISKYVCCAQHGCFL